MVDYRNTNKSTSAKKLPLINFLIHGNNDLQPCQYNFSTFLASYVKLDQKKFF